MTERAIDIDDRVESTDVSRLLFANSLGVRLIAGFFVLTTVVFTVATISVVNHPAPSLVAMAIVSAAAIVLVQRHPDPYPRHLAWSVVTVVVLATVLVSWQLPSEGTIGRASWHLGASTWLLFFLTLRRRAWMAWLGFLLMTVVTMHWAIESGRGVGSAIGMLQTHAGILLVGTLFASNLRRTSARINAFNERSVAAAASYAAADAATEIRRQRVAELATAVVPLLEQIASGAPLSASDKMEFKSTEATLRDSVRGRHLMVPAVQESVRRARLRGVEVNVLDDRGKSLSDGSAIATVSTEIAAMLDQTTDGTVTIRLHPENRAVAVSFVAQGTTTELRHDWDENGQRID